MQEEVIINKIDKNIVKLGNIEEKQELMADSLQNKYNQLSKTVGKIHQNVKSQNNRYSQIMENLKEIKNNISKESTGNIEDKLELIIQQLEKQETQPQYNQVEKTSSTVMLNYKEYMYKWFNKNLKITKNPHNVIDMEELKTKIDKHFETEEEHTIDLTKIYNRLESYLKYWYNQHNNNISFEDIINTSLNNNKLYSYIKFIDIKEERENRIKNTIIAWLKEYTCEVEGTRTYTEDILRNIQPLFEENGWIITTPEEYSQLQEAGFTKVCVKRTFSQIIGKAVQDYYSHITKDTTQRDTPGNGHVTWYPNIEIIDKKASDTLQIKIKDELTNDIFDSDNKICKWLNKNLKYTGNNDDKIKRETLQIQLRQYHKEEISMISEDTLQRLLNIMLEKLGEKYNTKYEDSTGILSSFTIIHEENMKGIITKWVECHLEYTGNPEDTVSVEELNEKLLTTLYKKNITIIKDDLYQQIPEQLKNNFTKEYEYNETVNKILQQEVQKYDKENENIIGARLIQYKNLKQEDITKWVNKNIEQLLENNISNKKTILNNFNKYLTQNNTRNNTNQTLEQLLDEEIQKHYTKQNITLKLLKDNQDTYYAIIN